MRICYIFIFMVLSVFPAKAQVISEIKIEATRVELTVNGLQDAQVSPVIFQIEGPKPRIVIDFHSANLELNGFSLKNGPQHIPGSQAVKGIRMARKAGGGLRAVVDLKAGVSMSRHDMSNSKISIELAGAGLGSAEKSPDMNEKNGKHSAILTSGPRFFDNKVPYPRLAPHFRKPDHKPVVVIDPGHGGKDPGAIGRKGTREKDITYKAALELQKQLKATGRYKVIVTRDKDIYIDHEERLRIARAKNADLFISIHADSTKGTTARGASVYTLADRAKTRSKNIVNSQNWILDVDLSEQSNPVGDILVELAQRKTESQSELFANMLISDLGKSTKLIGNSHRRAGYFVLLAPDVPAVLLELGFLSNAQDEKLLKTATHRKKVLSAVTRSINTYFDSQKS